MKRMLPLLILCLLILVGCATEEAPVTQQSPDGGQQEKAKEQLLTWNDKYWSQYTLPEGNCAVLCRMGEDYALFSDAGILYHVSGEALQVQRSRIVEYVPEWEDAGFLRNDGRIAYYDDTREAYVILDNYLNEESVVTIREEMLSRPVISSDLQQVYYATSTGIRVLDMAAGTSRLLRQESQEVIRVDGLLFDDTVLYYTRESQAGIEEKSFIRTSDGSVYQNAAFRGQIETWDGKFGAVIEMDQPLGTYREIIAGGLYESSQQLRLTEGWDNALLTEAGSVVIQTLDENGLQLNLVDLETGRLMETSLLENRTELFTAALETGDGIWLWSKYEPVIFRWKPSMKAAGMEELFVSRPTLAQQDESGIQACHDRAAAMSERFGIAISIEQGNNRTSGADYSIYCDYRPEQYDQALSRLETVLEQIPAELLAAMNAMEPMRIQLVDDFDPMKGIRDGTGNVDMEEGCCLSVSICMEMEAIFLHELFHGMETMIYSRNDSLAGWNDCNPEGFSYLGSFSAYAPEDEQNILWLESGQNFFADGHSMVSSREDRAQIFLYACQDGNQELFASEAMQQKLRILCNAVRSSFGLQEYAEALLWEQYLIPAEE